MTPVSTHINPLAGQPAKGPQLVDVAKLIAAYFSLQPDPTLPAQRVSFGTSGHRGTSFDKSFNEAHVLAITQAICLYRQRQGIDGPLFIGIDTHALSLPAFESALEVLAANGIETLVSKGGEYTPTPAVSHAILVYNRGRETGLADGIVVTPSHNPPDNGGFKYNPPNGGPADTDATGWIEARANAILEGSLKDVRRIPFDRARRSATTREHDFMEEVDPTFGFMTLDWDGRIRMDPSSAYAMRRLIGLKDSYDIAFACDTDHDRHGIVTPSEGLMPSNHYLAVAIDYLYKNRVRWNRTAAVGKTVVSSAMIDRVTARLGRRLYEAPVGFKWFVDGLLDGTLGFGGEESAGASFVRIDGTAWTTDKDGIVPALLAAEMTARSGRDPAELYRELTRELGAVAADRVEAPATPEQKQKLAKLSPEEMRITELAGEPIDQVLDRAPGNNERIGGIKVIAASGWFAARPSGTEDIYKIYAESFRGIDHLRIVVREAQEIVDRALQKH